MPDIRSCAEPALAARESSFSISSRVFGFVVGIERNTKLNLRFQPIVQSGRPFNLPVMRAAESLGSGTLYNHWTSAADELPHDRKSHVNLRACVIGAGPNGLAAAIVLAQCGLNVEVFEAELQIGGAARTLELTLPGFRHDFGSAVYPLAAGSPFFSSLPLSNHGLEWIHSPCPLAHPFDDGTAITLERDLHDAESWLGDDGRAWRRLMQPFVERWSELSSEVLQPIHVLSRHPFLLARFGLVAFPPAKMLARILFR